MRVTSHSRRQPADEPYQGEALAASEAKRAAGLEPRENTQHQSMQTCMRVTGREPAARRPTEPYQGEKRSKEAGEAAGGQSQMKNQTGKPCA